MVNINYYVPEGYTTAVPHDWESTEWASAEVVFVGSINKVGDKVDPHANPTQLLNNHTVSK